MVTKYLFFLYITSLIVFLAACSTTKDKRLQIPIEIRDYQLGGKPGSSSKVTTASQIKSPDFSTSSDKSLTTSTKKLSSIKSTTTTKNWPRVSRMQPTDANRVLIVSELGDAATKDQSRSNNIQDNSTSKIASAKTSSENQIIQSGSHRFIWPADGNVIRKYDGVKLKGIEIGGKVGEPVIASANGLVIYTGSGLKGYGKLIVIKHDNDYLSVYGHNSKILVKERYKVSQGEKIAEIGDTDANRPKLFFQIRKNKASINPQKILPKK